MRKTILLVMALLFLAACSASEPEVKAEPPVEEDTGFFTNPGELVAADFEFVDCVQLGSFCVPEDSIHVVAVTKEGKKIYGLIER